MVRAARVKSAVVVSAAGTAKKAVAIAPENVNVSAPWVANTATDNQQLNQIEGVLSVTTAASMLSLGVSVT